MINSYTSWQPLEEVIVGRAYSPDYFDFIDNAQVRNQLQQILSETEEDLNNLQKVIEQYGSRVRRPNLPNKDQFVWWQTEGGGAPLPPLTPRDWQITLGDKLLRVLPMTELDEICADYKDQVINPHKGEWDPDCILNGASASCIVRVGRDVFFDNSEYLRPDQTKWIVENCLGPEYRIHEAVTDGHGDAVFAILKPGVILSSNKWTGFVAETVFDVNCLVLDEENVIFSAYNKDVFDFCHKHKINPIISELRHSYFWDGGISCCTQDLRRRGGLETYL
jgi:glycine amidinotransferase/scyllo-inosamine-4-phosphate amidinotransferase 1